MSREQWGHGYHKGIDDVLKGKRPQNRFVVTLNEHGEVLRAYMIWGQNEAKYVVEDIHDVLTGFHLTGLTYHISEAEEDIDLECVTEKTLDELSEFAEPKFFINDTSFWGFVIQNSKLSDKRWKDAERLGVTIDEYYEKKMYERNDDENN